MNYNDQVTRLGEQFLTADVIANHRAWCAPSDMDSTEAAAHLNEMGWDVAPVEGKLRLFLAKSAQPRLQVGSCARDFTSEEVLPSGSSLWSAVERLAKVEYIF